MSENNNENKLYCDIIGIDLGTSNSVVAVMKNDKVEIIPSTEGSNLTPSCVSYFKGQDLVGQTAAAKKWIEPKNTIFDAKRFIGMEFDDRLKELASRYYQFQVVDGGGKKPLFSLTHKDEPLLKRPQDISALVLKRLRETAERKLKCRATDIVQIREAVITVPAYFSMAQKRATIEAATIAGFERVKLITEPAAAAYAYGYEKQRLDDYRILVFDFGGGTFDVTVLDVRKGEFVQRAIDGDILLGGRDLDILLRDHCAAEIKRQWKYDYMKNEKDAQELLEMCEKMKCQLSVSEKGSIEFELSDEGPVEMTVSRKTFDDLCRPTMMQAVEIVRRLLADTRLTAAQIDEVLLVGGTSRIPLVRSLLISELGFDPKQLNGSENPDHAVAMGAAIMGAQLCEHFKTKIPCSMKLTEVIPLTIGTDKMSDLFDPIVPRNTPIPFSITKTYFTGVNNQWKMQFSFFEGERKLAKENSFLGKLTFSGLKSGMANTVSVQLTVEIDRNGLLNARATHGNRTVEMNMDAFVLRRSWDRSMSEVLRSAALNSAGDSAEEQRLMARDELEVGIERSRYRCSKRTRSVCDRYRRWMNKHRHTGTREKFAAKHAKLRRKLGQSYRSDDPPEEEQETTDDSDD